jgi:hypothetical protein
MTDITRRTSFTWNIIRKYMRRDVIELVFRVLGKACKLDAFAEKLSAWLKLEMGRPRRQSL